MPAPGAPPCSLSRLFLTQVAQRPESTALKTPKKEITFSQLYSRAVAIKDALTEQRPNKNPEDRDDRKPRLKNTGIESRLNSGVVAVFCSKTQAAEICAVLGIILSGGCFVPVDESLPAPRLREVMKDAQPGAIIASRIMPSPPSRSGRAGHGRSVGAVIEAWRQKGCLVLHLEDTGRLSEPLEEAFTSAHLEEVSAPDSQAQERGCGREGDAASCLQHYWVGGEMRPHFVESATTLAAATAAAPAGVDGAGRVSGLPRQRVVISTDDAQRAERGGGSPIFAPSAERQGWSEIPNRYRGRQGVAGGDAPTDVETFFFDPPRGEEHESRGVRADDTETDLCYPPPRDEREDDGDLLYILYTSGTTGVPKGVKGTRSGAVNRIRFGWELCPFRGDSELVSRRTPSCFVDFVAEVLCPLLAGVPLFLAPDGAHADPLLLVPYLVKAKVTRITLTPSLLASLLRTADSYASPLLPDLHTWLVSGEALHPELALLFRDLTAPGTQLINLYGSTEVSGDATYCTLDEIAQSGLTTGAVSGGVLIGKPLPGVHLSVVGPDLLPVPVGQPGELLVGGVGVALGYHCRPQEAATKFLRSAARDKRRAAESGVHVPGLEPGRRVFRTGDRVVQLMPGGPLFWLGKLDGEVKVRGVRVSLEEAEILACRATGLPPGAFSMVYDPGKIATSHESRDGPKHDGMAAVVATSDPDRGRILGFFVPKGAPDTTDKFTEIKRQMATEMTAAQLPAVLLPVLEGFPLTSTGKVDKKTLLTEYHRNAGRVPEDRFPPATSDADRPAFSTQRSSTGPSRVVQSLASARATIAHAVVAVLPDARAALLPWTAGISVVDQEESRDLSHLTFDGMGGTSLLAVEAAWLASRGGVAHEGAKYTFPAPATLLTAEYFLRGTLEDAALTLTATLQAKRDAAEVEVGFSPERAKDESTAGLPASSMPLLRAVRAAASSASVQPPRVGRKRRLQAGKGYQEENEPPGFLAIGRSGVGSRYAHACLGVTAGSKGGVVSRVELRIRWLSCLTKCIDASPLVVVPVAASRTAVGRAKRGRSVEANDVTYGARVESTSCESSLYSRDSSLACAPSNLLRGTTGGEAGVGKKSPDRVLQEATGRDGLGVQGKEECLGEGAVYIGSHSGELQALNLVTGGREWSFTASGRIESGAACSFDGSTVFVGCHDRCLYALDRRTGALAWSFETGDAIKCTPVCANLEAFFDGDEDAAEDNGLPSTVRAVLVGSHDGFLRCLSQAHGSLLWSLNCGAALFASPVYDVNGCVIYAATTKGHVFAVEGAAWASRGVGAGSTAARADVKQRTSGEVPTEPVVGESVVLWKRQLPAPCFSTPAVCDVTGNLVLGCVDGGLYCLSSTGEQLWVCRRSEKPVFSSPCILPRLWEDGGGDKEVGRRVIWGSHDGNVRCGWDQDLAWETDIDKGRPIFASPCFAAVACELCTRLCGLVFACSVPGLICVLDLSSGVVVGEEQLSGEVFSSAVVSEKSLVVGCRDNRVYVLDILVTCAQCAKAG